jgi:hypothetical protein
VIITGVSNAEQLCNFPDPRMANPTGSLLGFTYIAAGHTHIRVNRIIVINPAGDLTQLPAPIEAETYVRATDDQYVQIRLAGADPKSIEIEAKFEVGLKANVSYVVDAELEGEAAIKVSLKPVYAAEIIRSTGEAMAARAAVLGSSLDEKNFPSITADILRTGLQHLTDIEDQYEEEFGKVGLDVKVTGGIGVGAWDTAISGLSVNKSFNLTYPLYALLELGAGALEDYLQITMGMVTANRILATSLLEGEADLAAYESEMRRASSDFVNGIMQELLDASAAEGFTIKSSFKLTLLGDADKEAIDVYESSLTVPVGALSASLQANPNAFGDAFSAVSHLMLAAIDPDVTIPEQTWTNLEQVLVPGFLYTFKSIEPVTFSLVGFEDADLLDTVKVIATLRNLLISIVDTTSDEVSAGSMDDVKSAVDTIIQNAIIAGDETMIDLINRVNFPRSRKIGVNGSLGAEAVAELGAGIEVKGEVRAGLFLLLLDLEPNLYNGTHDTVLSKASVPVDFSLDVGASVGEGVEATVDAGGGIGFNLFELSVKHWDEALPTPALMEVAGFSVLEFDGVVNQDGSFAGSGLLMLPMGGIVRANFDVDAFGNLISGDWEGGINLGPIGNFPLIGGVLDDDGLLGIVEVGLLGSSFDADFNLQSSGLLFGSYEGDLIIAGQQLASISINLEDDGEFRGQYQGDIALGGFVVDADLLLNNNGFAGSGTVDIFGSDLIASDLAITRTGRISGTFNGELVVGGHTLSGVSLRAVKGGLVGTAMMDLPGAVGAQVDLRILNGEVSAFYQGSLFDGLTTGASFEMTDSAIILRANVDASMLPALSGQVLNVFLDAAELANDELLQAQQELADAQQAVDDLERQIDDVSAALAAQLAAAQQAVIDRIREAREALEALQAIDAQIAQLNQQYELLLYDAQALVDSAQAEVNYFNSVIRSYSNQIASLDRWYNNLSALQKAAQLAYYTARRAYLVSARAAAITARNSAQLALDAAQLALDALNSELADRLNPLNATRTVLLATYQAASLALNEAEQALADIEAEIAADTVLAPLYVSLEAARIVLAGAQRSVEILEGTIELAEYAAALGTAGAFAIRSAHIEVDLDVALLGGSFEIAANVVYLGQQGILRFAFDVADPVQSFRDALHDLQSGATQLVGGDSTAPAAASQNIADWIAIETLVKLVASDNAGGSGVASITLWTTGAQVSAPIEIPGSDAYVLIDTAGQTVLNFFTTDLSGNVSATQLRSINVDVAGPSILVQPTGIRSGAYEVSVRADDASGSGIAYIAVSASGAESFTEIVSLDDETVIQLTREGETELTITSVDNTGNITAIVKRLTVPEIPREDTSGDSTNSDQDDEDSGSGSGGSSAGLFVISLLLMLWIFRVCRSTPGRCSSSRASP